MKALYLCILLFVTSLLNAQKPGILDKSYGKNGVSYYNEPYTHNAIAQQTDGKLITAGSYTNTGNFYRKGSVMRFLQNGKIDSSFGNNGFANYPAGSKAYGLVLQTNKMILSIGLVTVDDKQRAYVARLTLKGTLDSTFGVNGVTLIPDYNDYSRYDNIKLEPDGSLIIAGGGTRNAYSVNNSYMILSHVSANGIFDTIFGKNGRIEQRFPNYIGVEEKALAIQKDGKILVGGYVVNGGIQDQKLVICRYRINGTLDDTFSGTGTIITQGVAGENGENDMAGIIVQADRKILIGVTASSNKSGKFMAALRYNSDGTLDNTFGILGRALVSFSPATPYATAILLQPDGKFVLTGYVNTNSLQYEDAALCRVTANGSLDSSFGINGKQISDFSDYDYPTCATLQQDGKIVLGGSYFYKKAEFDSYSLIRYYGYSITQIAESVSGISSITTTLNKASLISLYPNPASDYVLIKELPTNSTTYIIIADAIGNVQARRVSVNNKQYRFRIASLFPGTYYINITTGSQTETLKFIKE